MIVPLILTAALATAPSVANHTMPTLTAPHSATVMTGLKVPYKGKFYRPAQAKYQLCVLRRESNGHWFSTNKSGGYAGAFQFNAALARGATWMMTPELTATYGPVRGKKIAALLRRTPMNKWLPVWQAQAFFTVLNWRGDWSGKRHWAGGRFHC